MSLREGGGGYVSKNSVYYAETLILIDIHSPPAFGGVFGNEKRFEKEVGRCPAYLPLFSLCILWRYIFPHDVDCRQTYLFFYFGLAQDTEWRGGQGG